MVAWNGIKIRCSNTVFFMFRYLRKLSLNWEEEKLALRYTFYVKHCSISGQFSTAKNLFQSILSDQKNWVNDLSFKCLLTTTPTLQGNCFTCFRIHYKKTVYLLLHVGFLVILQSLLPDKGFTTLLTWK